MTGPPVAPPGQPPPGQPPPGERPPAEEPGERPRADRAVPPSPRRGARALVLRLHRWAGLGAGAFIAAVSLSGAALVVAPSIDRALHRELWWVGEGPEERVAPSAVLASVRARHPDRRVEALVFEGEPRRSVRAVAGGLQVFLHPRTGEILGERRQDETLEARLVTLHTTLFAGRVGRWLVGASTVVLLSLIPLGLWLWWPTARRAFREGLVLRLRRGWKRAVYDLHDVVGFYASAVLLLVAGTGVIFAYPGIRQLAARVVARVAPVERALEPAPAGGVAGGREPLDLRPGPVLDRVLARVELEVPDAVRTRVALPPPEAERPIRVVALPRDAPHPGATDVLLFDGASGAPLRLDRHADLPLAARLDRLMGPIHLGTLVGWPSRALVFLASVVGASLPITGALIWYPRRRRRRRRTGPKAARSA